MAPSLEMQPAVAKNEYVLVMTSSPGLHRAEAADAVHREQCIGAGRDSDCVGGLEMLRKLPLERLHLGAHDEATAVADPGDGGEDLVPNGTVLCLQIQERY